MTTEDTVPKLLCPKVQHLLRDTPVYMEEDPEDDSIMVCPSCQYVFQNLLKYPVMQVINEKTGEVFMKNMLTGEREGGTR